MFFSGFLPCSFYFFFNPSHKVLAKPEKFYHHHHLFFELKLWNKVGKILLPVLLFNLLLCSLDYVFWTLGPLLPGGSYFMFVYSLPLIFIAWYSEKITHKLGKKVTAFSSFLLGSLVLTLFFWVRSPVAVLVVIFISSLLVSLAWPSLNGAYVDYLIESPDLKKEIEGLNDFSTNLGQIVGPIIAGLFADLFGIHNTFGFVGILNIAFVLILISFTPRHIKVHI